MVKTNGLKSLCLNDDERQQPAHHVITDFENIHLFTTKPTVFKINNMLLTV